MNGKVVDILISEVAGGEMFSLDTAELVPGKGIAGDRYYKSIGTFSEMLLEKKDFEVTLIESEEIELFNNKTGLGYTANDFRRNIITKGIRLSEIIGKEFNIGNVRLKVTRYCEPCAHLSNILGPEIMEYMVHKSGIRTIIVSGGTIEIGSGVNKGIKLEWH